MLSITEYIENYGKDSRIALLHDFLLDVMYGCHCYAGYISSEKDEKTEEKDIFNGIVRTGNYLVEAHLTNREDFSKYRLYSVETIKIELSPEEDLKSAENDFTKVLFQFTKYLGLHWHENLYREVYVMITKLMRVFTRVATLKEISRRKEIFFQQTFNKRCGKPINRLGR